MQNRMMITGAGSGLGREIALRWAREGWQLALSDVSEPGLQETLKQKLESFLQTATKSLLDNTAGVVDGKPD